MTEIKKEHEVRLSSPIKYSHAGESIEGLMVVLYPPSARQLKNTVALKQFFFQAINSMTDSSGKEKKKKEEIKEMEMDGIAVLSMMYMSNIDMNAMFESARKLLISGVAKVDDKESLTDAIIEKISVDDYEKIVGDYLVNFILASALATMKSLD